MVMLCVAAGLLLSICVCLARPAEHKLVRPGSLDSVDPLLGFPPEYLPIAATPSLYVPLFLRTFNSMCLTYGPSRISADGVSSINLTLPISPASLLDFSAKVVFNAGSPPRGVDLVSSLAASVYNAWQNTANLRILDPFDGVQQPFNQIYYQVRPSNFRGTSLTPLKLGLATCQILRLVLLQPGWPGVIRATMFDTSESPSHQKLEDGSMTITNLSPHPVGPLTSTADKSDSSGLTIPSVFESRWLSCFTQVLFFMVQHPVSAMVTDDPLLSPKQTTTMYRFFCGSQHAQLDLIIDPAANRESRWRLSWDRLIREMVAWVNQIAFGPEHQYIAPHLVFTRGVRQAALSILLLP